MKQRTDTNLVIVEPHADDAFLSLHDHILEWVREGNHVCIVTPSSEPRRMREAEAYARKVGADWMEFKSGDILPTGQLVLPLGIKHPDHTRVRRTFDAPAAWFYLDMPYALVQRDGDLVASAMRGLEVVSFLKPHGRKWQDLKIFESQSSYFSMYHRDEQLKNAAFELILRRASPIRHASRSTTRGG